MDDNYPPTESSLSKPLRAKTFNKRSPLVRFLLLLFAALLLKTLAIILWEYRNYFPPNMNSDFLVLHASHFDRWYQIAFYTHIASAPLSLVLFCISSWKFLRTASLRWHRRIGNVNAVVVLIGVVPSSLYMAQFSLAGTASMLGFATSSILLGVCMVLGILYSRKMSINIRMHRRWMLRAFILLASAIFLRALGGATELLRLPEIQSYGLASWLSWLLPLGLLELFRIAIFENNSVYSHRP